MAHISPGVYTKIIDLSTYVSAVPATTAFMCALTKKGRDNEAIFVSSRNDLIREWGKPDITTFGKDYGQGLYNAYNYLGESGSLWFMRVMPEHAYFSNIRIDAIWDGTDSTAEIVTSYISNTSSIAELNTKLEQVGNVYPICMIYPIGRGDYYNLFSIRLTRHANPMYEGIYILDIYEKQDDGDEVIIESFSVSFNPEARDLSGDSIFISDILLKYSNYLRASCMLPNGEYSPGYNLCVKNFDNDIGWSVTEKTPGIASITDPKQEFLEWATQSETGMAAYSITAIDQRGNRLYGWLGHTSPTNDYTTINVFNDRDLSTASQEWVGDTAIFDDSDISVTYYIKKDLVDLSEPFLGGELALKKGSDGELFDINHNVDPTVCGNLLAAAYHGDIDESILDKERLYFTLVFDAGYPTRVKQAISYLVNNRRDCVALLDNGDNADFRTAMGKRTVDHIFNSYLCALYEGYNKIYDTFTGSNIWVSPLYHMAYLAPRNDNVAEIWYAIAGFERGVIDNIQELRFNPRLEQRDQMYMKQLNPIVKFNIGYSVWGQLTTQAKASALQDLNIVRLVLYCKEALERYCRFYIFTLNDSLTWSRVSNDITSFLESVSAKRGLYSYSIEVGATPYEIKTKTFHVNVTLTPTRVTEKIELNFYIK